MPKNCGAKAMNHNSSQERPIMPVLGICCLVSKIQAFTTAEGVEYVVIYYRAALFAV